MNLSTITNKGYKVEEKTMTLLSSPKTKSFNVCKRLSQSHVKDIAENGKKMTKTWNRWLQFSTVSNQIIPLCQGRSSKTTIKPELLKTSRLINKIPITKELNQ